MCYSNDARPPLPPIVGGSTDEGDLILTAADGNRLRAYAARAATPSGAGVVVIPDPRGVHPFYKELVRRFAQAGMDAVVIDYLDRTAGMSERPENFDLRAAIGQTRPDAIAADVAAGIAYLRSAAGGTVGSVFTVGFCFGGAQSWRQSAVQPGLAGAIGFYGIPARVREVIPQMRAPLLLLLAGDDQATTPEDFDNFDKELTAAGVPHQKVVYDGAPHSFFDRRFEEHKAASADAWQQMLAFIAEHTRQPART
ncbi:MAG: dienelactone hydrolase family protein [Chloroflexi bacterium]|nr:MAG: dienelactone hydrolase family protein [Chloroflexota bacterium]